MLLLLRSHTLFGFFFCATRYTFSRFSWFLTECRSREFKNNRKKHDTRKRSGCSDERTALVCGWVREWGREKSLTNLANISLARVSPSAPSSSLTIIVSVAKDERREHTRYTLWVSWKRSSHPIRFDVNLRKDVYAKKKIQSRCLLIDLESEATQWLLTFHAITESLCSLCRLAMKFNLKIIEIFFSRVVIFMRRKRVRSEHIKKEEKKRWKCFFDVHRLLAAAAVLCRDFWGKSLFTFLRLREHDDVDRLDDQIKYWRDSRDAQL